MAFVQNLEYVVPFGKKDEHKIDDQEDRSPYHSSSKALGLTFHMHERPGDIVSFYYGKDDEDPVEDLKADEIILGKYLGLDNPQDDLYQGDDRKVDKNRPDPLGAGLVRMFWMCCMLCHFRLFLCIKPNRRR